MSPNSPKPRFVLFPQVAMADGEGKRPTVRRYSLARLHAAPDRGADERYGYLKRSHD